MGKYDGLKAGDSFLLCSDGLWHYFNDAELGAAVVMETPRESCEMLINKSRVRARGSKADNCTLIVVRVIEPPEEPKTTARPLRRAV